MIKPANKFSAVLGEIQYDNIEVNEDMNKTVVEAQYQRNIKYKQNKSKEDEEMSEGLHTCGVFVNFVLAFHIDHIKKLKGK